MHAGETLPWSSRIHFARNDVALTSGNGRNQRGRVILLRDPFER